MNETQTVVELLATSANENEHTTQRFIEALLAQVDALTKECQSAMQETLRTEEQLRNSQALLANMTQTCADYERENRHLQEQLKAFKPQQMHMEKANEAVRQLLDAAEQEGERILREANEVRQRAYDQANTSFLEAQHRHREIYEQRIAMSLKNQQTGDLTSEQEDGQ